ncbi:cyclase family protein [Patescibacteria group bacterium]|nr:cyclase family protein [Patescibacteria group bacterium]MBU1500837.1 cyclase family protein [Patescibacteria group bacterium]MBU2080892.1 cyclase family protein [Patescibacteria group bacterium]MBU2123997.1 cyclase family protein [Patescibacteria group bacterium]MBU2194712.1 cyclase family protein [Patescibacteria group bacterium]
MFVDLSVLLNEETPVYPGDPQTHITPAGLLHKDGYKDHYVCIGTHVGTHMDAPSHMLENGKNLNDFPLERFSGRGVLIEVNESFNIEEVKSAAVQKGDVVLFNTELSARYQEDVYFTDYPAMSEEIAQFLIEKEVGIVGVDTCSVDNIDGFPIHKLLLQNEVLIIENLTNLKILRGKNFRVHAFPVKLAIDGAPVRAVAELI